MGERSWLYNSAGGDRAYNAEDIGAFLAPFFSGGVFAGVGTNLQVTADGSMNVKVQPGYALIKTADGKLHMYEIKGSALTLPIAMADGANNRIDRIVIRHETANRYAKAQVKTGIYAENPVAPAVQQDADYWELALADVTVNAGTAAITQSMITDQRLNSAVCGIVAATVQQLDTSAFYAQLQAYFNEQKSTMTAQEQAWAQEFLTWFSGIKGKMDGDVATKLLEMINTLAGSGWTNETVKGNADAIKALAGDNRTTETVKGNADRISQNAIYQKPATGSTETNITLNYATQYDGYVTNFIAATANNAAATTINGKPLYKPNTTIAPNLVAGKAYTVWYDSTGDCFFLKASAEGDAIAADVRKGKVISTDVDTGIVGTLDLSQLISGNLRKDVTIDGVVGTFPVLPFEYNGQRVYTKYKALDPSFNTYPSYHTFLTTDKKIIYHNDVTIFKYDIETGVSTILGVPSARSAKDICGIYSSDDGSIVYVNFYVGDNVYHIYYFYNGLWADTGFQVQAYRDRSFVCNPDGSELYYISGFTDSPNTSINKWVLATKTTSIIKSVPYLFNSSAFTWVNDGSLWVETRYTYATGHNGITRIKISNGDQLMTISLSDSSIYVVMHRDANLNILGSYHHYDSGSASYRYCRINNDRTSTVVYGSVSRLYLAGSLTGLYQILSDSTSTNPKTMIYKISESITPLIDSLPYVNPICLSEDYNRWFTFDGYECLNYLYQ